MRAKIFSIFCSSSAKICQKPLILSTPGTFQNYGVGRGGKGLMKIPLKHLVKEESCFLSFEVTPEALQTISNLSCPADLPPHTPIQEWHIQHLMGPLQRKLSFSLTVTWEKLKNSLLFLPGSAAPWLHWSFCSAWTNLPVSSSGCEACHCIP